MTQEFLEHVTQDGERWDHLADRYYGDPARYEPIIRANPQVAIAPILPAGLRLRIPMPAQDAAIPAEELPPWKRPR